MTHASRYASLYDLAQRSNLDCSYHAAFYLLSGQAELYELVCDYVDCDGIHFEKIKQAARNCDERTRFIIDIAHNLFIHTGSCEATPFEICQLGYPFMEQVCNALYIASGGMTIKLQSDDGNHYALVLDDHPYQSIKRFYDLIETTK